MQIPRDVPHPDTNTPVDFTNPLEIIVYIVIPVALFFAYFYFRRKSHKNLKDDEQQSA